MVPPLVSSKIPTEPVEMRDHEGPVMSFPVPELAMLITAPAPTPVLLRVKISALDDCVMARAFPVAIAKVASRAKMASQDGVAAAPAAPKVTQAVPFQNCREPEVEL